ncbi:dicarboxylate/amino acid:cation symporter [soil metagenome]
MPIPKTLKNYLFLLLLLVAILGGSVLGYAIGPRAASLKPLGDIFLNLMFTVVVPLVFFSVASAIASMDNLQRIGKVLGNMMVTFLFTSIIAAIFMIVVVKLFPPAQGISLTVTAPAEMHHINIADQIVTIFTVSDFLKLFSRENILALIFFAVLIGLATASLGEKGKPVANLLQIGTDIFMKAVGYVMYYAPIGFFAYFAVLVAELGPKLLESYLRATIVYYVAALIYFIFAYTLYAYLAKPKGGIKIFWQNSILPIMTALATCSSAASIPANLQATKKMGVPAEIYETVVPLGAIIHKDGSVLGGVIKIAFLFGVYHMDFAGPHVLLTALFISLLVGTVIGAIPSGGMVAELLILSLYGFPPQALIIIAAITLIIDAPATMLNVTGNTVSSMLVARLTVGKRWLK